MYRKLICGTLHSFVKDRYIQQVLHFPVPTSQSVSVLWNVSQMRCLSSLGCTSKCSMHYLSNLYSSAVSENLLAFNHISTAANTIDINDEERVDQFCMKYYNILQADDFDSSEFSKLTSSLCSDVFSNIHIASGWISIDIVYIQMALSGCRMELLTKPLYGSKYFNLMHGYLIDNALNATLTDCPLLLQNFLLCGVSRTDLLVEVLISRCLEMGEADLGLQQIQHLGNVFKLLDNRAFDVLKLVHKGLALFVKMNVFSTDFNLKDLSSLMNNNHYFSGESISVIGDIILRKLKHHAKIDAATFVECLRYANKTHSSKAFDYFAKLKIKDHVQMRMDNILRCIGLETLLLPELMPLSIACKHLHRCTSGVKRLQQYSLQLLTNEAFSQNMRLADIVGLMSSLLVNPTAILTCKHIQGLCKLLHSRIGDTDILTMSSVASLMLNLKLFDEDLVLAFQEHVLNTMDQLAKYISCFSKVMQLLRRTAKISDKHNGKLCSALLHQLSTLGYRPSFVVLISTYLLPALHPRLPSILLERLSSVVPNLSAYHLMTLADALKETESLSPFSASDELHVIWSLVMRSVSSKLDTVPDAATLAYMIKVMMLTAVKDLRLVRHAMDVYSRLTKNMTPLDFQRTVYTFRYTVFPYWKPDVFEDLISVLPAFPAHRCMELLPIFALAGYQPENIERFTADVCQIIEKNIENGKLVRTIFSLCLLSVMHVFPDLILKQVFSIDFLEALDREVEGLPASLQHRLRQRLMSLNRSVVLECPHLDVPWFSDEFCKLSPVACQHPALGFQRYRCFLKSVMRAISTVMTSHSDCVGYQVYSPYYHAIDFEVVLDTHGCPVSRATSEHRNDDTLGYERVALLTVGEEQLCLDGQRQRGEFTQKCHHLEMLGYRVEKIALDTWEILSAAGDDEKICFIHNMIFSKSEARRRRKVMPLSA